jgi:tetratricopeptide (TPR) repeat protein
MARGKMNQKELRSVWSDVLRKGKPTTADFDRLADAVISTYGSDPDGFRQHMKNRFGRVTQTTGQAFDPDNFDQALARAFIADELGISSWDLLIERVGNPQPDSYPMLFQYAIAALGRGDFTALEKTIGADRFDGQIQEWIEAGLYANEPETRAESFAAVCMLGYEKAAAALLDAGVDPYAGMRTGLAGFHYAASSGRLNVIKLLIDRDIPMEVENMYGGTVFGQAMWSAIHENTPDHPAIVEALIEAGAVVDRGYLEWWREQDVPDEETKRRIENVLQQHAGFYKRVDTENSNVVNAEKSGTRRELADALKKLGDTLRRPKITRAAANEAYRRAAEIYHDIGLPLEESWVKRHIGINLEYEGKLEEAEFYYLEALDLFRRHGTIDDLNYANTVRYPAVIKNRLGKRQESKALWEEAFRRYKDLDLPVAIAEAAAWLAIFALDANETAEAQTWFAIASEAAERANDHDTFKFVGEVNQRITSMEKH